MSPTLCCGCEAGMKKGPGMWQRWLVVPWVSDPSTDASFQLPVLTGQLPAACGASLTHLATSSPLQPEGADEIRASLLLWFVYLVLLRSYLP